MDKPTDTEVVLGAIRRLAAGCSQALGALRVPLTPFHVAVAEGRTGVVRAVLQDINDKDVKKCFLNAEVAPCCRRPKRRGWALRWKNALKTRSGVVYPVQRNDADRQLLFADTWSDPESRLPTTTLEMAAFSGNVNTLLLLIEHGANPELTNSVGNNVVHYVIELAEKHPDRAVRLYKALTCNLDLGTLSALLAHENDRGMVPLEQSAEQAVPEMMSAILATDGVYRHVMHDCGTHRHVRYDVTRYESEQAVDRQRVHLLYYLTCATEQDVIRMDQHRLIQSEPLCSWIQVKYRQYSMLVGVCFAFRFAMLVAYVGTLAYILNYTEPPHGFWSVALFLANLVTVAIGTADVVGHQRSLYVFWRRLFQRRVPVCTCAFYRFYHFAFCCSVIAASSMLLFGEADVTTSPWYVGVHVSSLLFGVLSLLFYLQLDQAMGHMLTAIEKMFVVAVEFASLTCIIYLAIALSFYIYHWTPMPPCHQDPDGNQTTDPEEAMFSTFGRSLYETILIAIGVMIPRSIYFSQASFPDLAIALYALSLVTVFIVLMNMMLAFINKRLLEIDEHRQSILMIQKLSVTLFVSTHRVLQVLTKRFRFLRRDGGMTFVKTENPDKVFISVVEK